MQRFEYKHVRWKLRFSTVFSQEAWEQELMSILTVNGNEGWELKSILYEMTWHYHLIFARAVAPGEPVTWKPGQCRCGYDLTGNTSGVCPECGAAVLAIGLTVPEPPKEA